MKWFFIINPVSGKGDGLRIWKQINKQLAASSIRFEHAVSDYHQHALKLVDEKYRAGYRNFIGIGGDGTLNEMVNAVFHASSGKPAPGCVFGLVPVGTGNDWVRSQNITVTADNLVDKLRQHVTKKHDVGVIYSSQLVKPYYFLNVAGAGLDGSVVKEIARKAARGQKGKLAYLTGLLRALFNYTAPEVEVKQADVSIFKGFPLVITAAKGRYFGGGMQISPNAKQDDGFLDCTVVEKVAKRKIFPQLHKLFNGQINTVSFVQKVSAQEITVQSENPLTVQADGEFVGEASEIKFALAAQEINVLT